MAICYLVRIAGCDAGASYPAYGAERRSDKAFTPHPTLMARFTVRIASGAYSPFFAA